MHDSQRMYFNSFGDPLTFPLAPPAGQIFYFYQVNISRAATWPGTKFGTGIHSSQKCIHMTREVNFPAKMLCDSHREPFYDYLVITRSDVCMYLSI